MPFPADKVLLVDGNPFTRRLVRGMLEDIGRTRVHTASSALSALDVLRHQPVDVILLDWHMPDLDGEAFLARLRAAPHPRLAVVPAVVTSPRVDIAMLSRAARHGASSVLAKPFSKRLLLGHLNAALGRSETPTAAPAAMTPVQAHMPPSGNEADYFYL